MTGYISKYFPELSSAQHEQMDMLLPLYEEWNSKINVISRKDIEHLYLHHVLHSLAIAKVVRFRSGTAVLDVGTGGGFPGIPLAIMFPDVSFCLVDSIGKKIRVVKAITGALQLANVSALQLRAEEVKEKYDFIVSRAVTTLNELYAWTSKNISNRSQNEIPNGILYLKGGDLSSELKELKVKYDLHSVAEFFGEEYFREKFIVHLYPQR
jgi:16S rRNA (guanine527-N7)-methyltransferase